MGVGTPGGPERHIGCNDCRTELRGEHKRVTAIDKMRRYRPTVIEAASCHRLLLDVVLRHLAVQELGLGVFVLLRHAQPIHLRGQPPCNGALMKQLQQHAQPLPSLCGSTRRWQQVVCNCLVPNRRDGRLRQDQKIVPFASCPDTPTHRHTQHQACAAGTRAGCEGTPSLESISQFLNISNVTSPEPVGSIAAIASSKCRRLRLCR